MTNRTYSEHETRARAIKVQQLVEALHTAGATPQTLALFTPSAWQLAADVAGVNAPSAETIAAVTHALELREQTRDIDPFAGLDAA